MSGPRAEAYLVDAVRTPVGKRGGGLSGEHPADLGAHVISALVERSGVDPLAVEDVVFGCVDAVGPQAGNIARTSWLAAGLPEDVPGVTVDRQCGSSQQAVHFAAQAVMSGTADLIVAGGVQNMSQIPISSAMTLASTLGFSDPFSGSRGWQARYGDQEVSQFRAAELIAEKWDISREEMERFALESHRRAGAAIADGRFEREILPYAGVTQDEGPRPDTSLEKMAGLKTLVPGGRLTAAVSSQISDAASGVLVASEQAVKDHGLTPRARIVHLSVRGADPIYMLTAPIPATAYALAKSGMKFDEIDLIEINEAFASVVLAWAKEQGNGGADETAAVLAKTNVNGGAISLGHPLGATGTRLMTTMLHELERTGGRYGLQTMCEGGGVANVTIIERLADRHPMELRFTDEEQAFRAEVREWLAANVPAEPLPSLDTAEGFERHREWEHLLHDAGWAVVDWPAKYGGRDATLVEWLVFEEEYYAAQAPRRVGQNGIFLLAPTIFEYGTDDQRDRFLSRMSHGDDIWAQAWSEPGAGSDLAALRSTAKRVDGGWQLSGQKTWSTRAAYADWAFGIFRTDPDVPKHKGLTYFLFPLSADGVTVRPIRQLDGEVGFAEIFCDDVFVPDADVLGAPGQGWSIAMSTTGSERGLTLRSPGRYLATADRLVALCRAQGDAVDPALSAAVAQCWIDAEAYRMFTLENVGRVLAGEQLGAESSLNKLFWSQLDIDLHETALRLLGSGAPLTGAAPAATEHGRWLDDYLFALAGPIYAGTNEIQRNVIAERVLGLPRGG